MGPHAYLKIDLFSMFKMNDVENFSKELEKIQKDTTDM